MSEKHAISVPTVRGPVGIDELGPVLTHEHLFVWNQEFHRNYPDTWDEAAGVERAAKRLDEAYELGVRTIVDMTVLGQGRALDLVARVAERTRMNIVLATGVYTLDGMPQILRYRGPGEPLGGPEPVVDLLERDVREGIAGSGVRAAMLKFVFEKPEPDPTIRRLAAAVAEVHRRTGVPVAVHTEPSAENAPAVIELLGSLGVDPRNVVLAHAGDALDPGHLRAVAETGAYIGCDRFGMQAIFPDERRMENVAALISGGHIGQVLLSHDCASFIDHFTDEHRMMMSPEWSYTHLHSRVLPKLREMGIGDEQITTILEENPRRLLAGSGTSENTTAQEGVTAGVD